MTLNQSKLRTARSLPSVVRQVAEVDGAPAIRRLADAAVEAGCLLAVLSLPLYFSVLAGGYEQDKAVLLRALACVTAVAWLTGFMLEPRKGGTRRWNVLLWLGSLVFAVCVVATLLSVDPRLSLWGSITRQQGLWTRAAYLVFLVAAATRLRTGGQVHRLISALLLGSVPVVTYGFLQQLGYDPVPSSGSPDTLRWPVWSSLGQHVFFGSYLVMVIPFTAGRLLQSLPAWQKPAGDWYRKREVLLAGAAIAAVGGSYIAFLGIGILENALFDLLPALLGIYVLVGLALGGAPHSPALERAMSAGYAGLLLAQILVLGFTGTRAAWLGALAAVPVFGFLLSRHLRRPQIARLILAGTVVIGLCLLLLNIPNGPLQPLRTMRGVNRIANITDSGGSEGSAQGRLFIWQGVGTLERDQPSIGGSWGGPARTLIGYGPETMPWAFSRVFPLKLRQVNSEINTWDRAHNIYLDYLIDSGLLGLLLIVAVVAVFFWRVLTLLPRASGPAAWILISSAAAMAGHLVDGVFSIETSVTLLLFWVLVGVVAGRALEADSGSLADGAAGEGTTPASGYPGLPLQVQGVPAEWTEPSEREGRAAGHAQRVPGPPVRPAEGPGPTGRKVLKDEQAAQDGVFRPGPAELVRLGGWFGLSLIVVAVVLMALSGTDHPALLGTVWILSVVASAGVVTAALTGRPAALGFRSVPRGRPWLLVGLAGLAGVLALGGQMRFETAAIADRTGTNYLDAQQWTQALPYLEQAAQTYGYEPAYDRNLAQAYFGLAGSRGDSAEPQYVPDPGDVRTLDASRVTNFGSDQLFQLAAFALDSAGSLSPLDPDTYYNLGVVYHLWGKPDRALVEFGRAEQLSINNPRYLDWEALAYLDAKQTKGADQRARAALALDSTFWLSHYTLALVDHQVGNRPGAKQEAALSLYWVRNYWPPPPAQQLDQLRSLARFG